MDSERKTSTTKKIPIQKNPCNDRSLEGIGSCRNKMMAVDIVEATSVDNNDVVGVAPYSAFSKTKKQYRGCT